MNKKIGILQPVYLPWLGFFEQMAYVDQFIIMDDVQYTKKDWRNRNKIKTASGSIWLTVPVRKHSLDTPINDIYINYSTGWVKRHLRSIELNYHNCHYFEPIYNDIKSVLEAGPEKLLELDVNLIRVLCGYLNINTQLAYSSEVDRGSDYNCNGIGTEKKNCEKNKRIIEICKYFSGDILYDGKSAEQFIDIHRFSEENIKVVFQDYEHPEYYQQFGEFISYQSAIDLIMNTGPDAGSILRSSPYPTDLYGGRG